MYSLTHTPQYLKLLSVSPDNPEHKGRLLVTRIYVQSKLILSLVFQDLNTQSQAVSQERMGEWLCCENLGGGEGPGEGVRM